jgi:aryl-alcohol dehydrogenase-like predicted oxidoreductase
MACPAARADDPASSATPSPAATSSHGPALERNLGQVAALREVAAGLGLTPGQLALAWLLAQGPDVVPIPGSRRPEWIAKNAAAAAAVLGPADRERLARALPRAAWAGNRHSFAARGTVRSGG